MARLFGFIGNRPDLGSRVLEAEAAVVFSPGGTAGGAGTFGWGVGHYQGGEVLLRRRPVDENPTAGLASALADVRSDALLAHLRHATVGGHRTENTQPFRYRQYLFAHTGTVAAFGALRDRLVDSLPEFLQRSVRGDTDSELLFHLFLSFLHDAGNLNTLGLDPAAVRTALRSTLSLVDRLSAEEGAAPSPFDAAITDGEHVVIAHSSDRLVYRQLVGRADLEEVLGDDRLRRVRIPDMASCRFLLFAGTFEQPVPTPGFTEVPVGSIVTFTRANDPSSSPSERPEARPATRLGGCARLILACLVWGTSVGCGARPAAFATRTPTALDAARTRTPDGVLTVRLPGAIAGAASALSADGDVALRPPLPLEAARDVVDAMLRAHVDEDFERLRELTLPDASTHNPTVGRGSSISLHASFRERTRRLDYRKLEGMPLAVKAEMEVYTLDDIGRLPPGRPEVPPEMIRGDALVRARIATPRVGPDRFFGDVVEVHLRSTDTAWLVVAVTEEMPMP